MKEANTDEFASRQEIDKAARKFIRALGVSNRKLLNIDLGPEARLSSDAGRALRRALKKEYAG